MKGLPCFVHESNTIPGRANRLASKFATSVLIGFEESRQRFPSANCINTGTPVRRNLGNPLERAEAMKLFGLDPSRQTLLVTGGSQGASGINQLLFKSAPILAGSGIQIIHLTGKNDDRLAAANYQRDDIPHYVAPFHHRMEEAYSASDLVISRAGASSLSEISKFGLPSILIPYPFATDDHQKANAEIYSKAGAAELVSEKEASPETFTNLIATLLKDSDKRDKMSAMARQIAPGAAASNVANVMEKAVWEASK
jgi:UDP-N-acetylglucosamine--N-acetylmuramyl-(pentapeptide) pyrophosphoryl-undecaprenol N-acetylglucosamine transferase